MVTQIVLVKALRCHLDKVVAVGYRLTLYGKEHAACQAVLDTCYSRALKRYHLAHTTRGKVDGLLDLLAEVA